MSEINLNVDDSIIVSIVNILLLRICIAHSFVQYITFSSLSDFQFCTTVHVVDSQETLSPFDMGLKEGKKD